MRRALALAATALLVAALGPSSVVAAPTSQPNGFHGDFDLVDLGDGNVVGHLVVDLRDVADATGNVGSLDVTWAAEGPIDTSHADFTGAEFGQQADSSLGGGVRWILTSGTRCDTGPAGTACGPFGMQVFETVSTAFPDYLGWSAPGTSTCCDGPWYQVGKGAFVLHYLGPAGKVAVAVTGATGPMQPGATRAFAATVSGAADESVYWSILEADGGSITQDGVYTAPMAPGIYTV